MFIKIRKAKQSKTLELRGRWGMDGKEKNWESRWWDTWKEGVCGVGKGDGWSE